MFTLFTIDMDASNEFEHKAGDYDKELAYKPVMLMSYKETEVDSVPLKQI